LIAASGTEAALEQSPALARGVATQGGQVVTPLLRQEARR
jgi:alanine dehydrogenase